MMKVGYLILMFDGVCHEFLNNKGCLYDGFDCCYDMINDFECKDKGCECFIDGQVHTNVRNDFPNCTVDQSILFNGECNGEANIQECNLNHLMLQPRR